MGEAYSAQERDEKYKVSLSYCRGFRGL
jgi:hypothetical protein